MASTAHEEHGHGHDHGGDHHHHEEHFVSKYIFSQDHKMISKQYLISGLFMGIIGIAMSLLFRLQLAWPEEPNVLFVETFINHAKSKKAKVLFAGVGIANAEDLEQPIYTNSDYVINYNGYKELL